jgi:hypothetical protein
MTNNDPSGFPVLSAHIVAMTNAVLFVLFAFMFAFALAHLWRLYKRELAVALPRRNRQWRAVGRMYRNSKPSIAIVVIIGSMFARVGLLAHAAYVKVKNIPPDWISDYTLLFYMMVNAALIIGVTCWIRNISPLRITNAQWVVILGTAVAFGIFAGL